jgi:cell cycle sensor histidine kinase DivJ
MRNLIAAIFGTSGADSAVGRPEAVRRETLAINGRLMLATGAIAAPLAIYLLIHGQVLPIMLAATALLGGLLSAAFHRAGQFERTVAAQIYATLAVGLMLASADPSAIDFGLAVALLGPIYAALMARSPVKRRRRGVGRPRPLA